MSKKFRVTVSRTTWSNCDIEVEAEDKHEASAKALAEAGNKDFGCGKDAEYDVEDVTELKT